MPIVYLIQPCELLGTDRYKIGRSSKDDLSRVLSYKKGTKYILIIECDNDKLLEKLLIKKFNEDFKKIAGNEFFEGDKEDMVNCFMKIVSDYKNEIEDEILKIPNVNWMKKYIFK